MYSEPGFGTTFRIYFPRIEEPASVHPDAELKRVVRPPSETILVVEDNDAVRVMLCRILRSLGYEVLEAQHARDALALCKRRERRIDMLISDVVMPDMNGIDLALELRASQPDLRVSLMSGYSGLAMTRRGELHANLPFLEKSFTPDTVAAKVSEVLEHAPSLPPSA